MINLVAAAIAFKADNWAGDGLKWLGYAFLAFCFLLPVVPLMAAMGAWGLLLIPYVIFCALAYRKWGAWGELFVDADDDPMDPKHKWFYRLVSKIYGVPYHMTVNNTRLQWKVIGWGVRYAIYCLPVALLYAASHAYTGDYLNIITPFVMMPIAGLVRGTVYWYGQTHKDLAWCEQWGGALAMFLIVSSGL